MPTVRSILTQPSPLLRVLKVPSTRTRHDQWDPVESVTSWHEFSPEILERRFKAQLHTSMCDVDLTGVWGNAGWDQIVDEKHLQLAIQPSFLAVATAVRTIHRNLILSYGSRFIHGDDRSDPDYGLGDTSRTAKQTLLCEGLAVGDAKLGWDHLLALKVLRAYWNKNQGYESSASARNEAAPLEQVQHYCRNDKNRYGWLVTEKGILVIRAKSSARQLRSSPRGMRARNPQAHYRVTSDESVRSELSDAMSKMSFDPSSDMEIAALEVAFVGWTYEKSPRWTPELALFCLCLLAAEDHSLAAEYPPLTTESQAAGNPTAIFPRQPPQGRHQERSDDSSSVRATVILPEITIYRKSRKVKWGDRHNREEGPSGHWSLTSDERYYVNGHLKCLAGNAVFKD